MDKKMKIIMIAAAAMALLGMIGGIAGKLSGDPAGASSSYNPAVFVGAFLPIIITVVNSRNPSNPVYNLIFVLSNKKYSIDKKKGNLDYYITKKFKKGEKYTLLIEEGFEKCKKVTVKERDKDSSVVLAELSKGEKYEFIVVKRTKENSIKTAGSWIIDDYRKV
jgi:hypothetical protein